MNLSNDSALKRLVGKSGNDYTYNTGSVIG